MALTDFLTPQLIAGIILLIFIVIIVASGIRVIKEWERAPVLRLGRFTGLKDPGLFYIIPFIDRIPNIVSM
jgi:regulator of protease activity HflC (stomatin/prohibitin superfamily)